MEKMKKCSMKEFSPFLHNIYIQTHDVCDVKLMCVKGSLSKTRMKGRVRVGGRGGDVSAFFFNVFSGVDRQWGLSGDSLIRVLAFGFGPSQTE